MTVWQLSSVGGLIVFKEKQEEKLVLNAVTNLKYFGEWTKWEAATQLDSR